VFVKPDARDAARALRREEGLPLREIADRLGVAKSSVSRWVRDIELSAKQHAALREMNPRYNAQLRGQDGRRASARAARVAAQEHGRALARRGDALHAQGCMLYWAEGAKSRNTAALVNSDAAMLRLFIRFLRECYGIGVDQMALTVNCYVTNGCSASEIVTWWLRTLRLPAGCARAPIVNRVSRASRLRRGHILPYGTARIAVHSTFLVQSIFGAIQEYGGFERPAWLD
jgi:transcriptional regulator with XRE-family HTH domain